MGEILAQIERLTLKFPAGLIFGLGEPLAMGEIERFLEQELGQGVMVDEGTFSLDIRAQVRKLSVMLRHSPWLHIVKMIQSAVVCKAEQFEITNSGHEMLVRFPLPTSPIPLDLLSYLFGQSVCQKLDWMTEISQAILYGLAAEGREFFFEFDDGHKRLKAKASGASFESTATGSTRPEFVFRVLHYPSKWWKLFASDERTKSLLKELQLRAGLTNMNLYLNDVCLSVVPFEFVMVSNLGRKSLRWMTEALWPTTSLESFSWPAPTTRFSARHCIGDQIRRRGVDYSEFPSSAESDPTTMSTTWLAGPTFKWLDSDVFEALSDVSLKRPYFVGALYPRTKATRLSGALVAGAYEMQSDRRDPKPWLQRCGPDIGKPISTFGKQADKQHPSEKIQDLIERCSRPLKLLQAAMLGIEPKGTAQLTLIYRGIKLDPVPVPDGPPGSHAIRYVEFLSVDAGQMTPVAGTPELEECKEWALGAWRALERDLARWVEDSNAAVPVWEWIESDSYQQAWIAYLKRKKFLPDANRMERPLST